MEISNARNAAKEFKEGEGRVSDKDSKSIAKKGIEISANL
jgi:hypothetical protein